MLNAQCYYCIAHLTQAHPLQLIWEIRDAYSVDIQIYDVVQRMQLG